VSLRTRFERKVVELALRVLRRLGCYATYFGRWRQYFGLGEALGIHVLPVHYLSPVPDTRDLPDRLWTQESSLCGVHIDYTRCLAMLEDFARRYATEYAVFSDRAASDEFHFGNGAFEAADAEMLYCMVRHFRPRRVIEIGSGYSTLVTARAVEKNLREGHACHFVAIEPYPKNLLRRQIRGLGDLIEKKVQDVPLDVFMGLECRDILLIDSTHVVRTGSDVCYELLEILPHLKPGVLVHLHDIFLPAEYPPEWIRELRFFWTEQYLLHAFLAFNREFEVLWPAHAMHLRYPGELARAFPSYSTRASPPTSFWMRRAEIAY